MAQARALFTIGVSSFPKKKNFSLSFPFSDGDLLYTTNNNLIPTILYVKCYSLLINLQTRGTICSCISAGFIFADITSKLFTAYSRITVSSIQHRRDKKSINVAWNFGRRKNKVANSLAKAKRTSSSEDFIIPSNLGII